MKSTALSSMLLFAFLILANQLLAADYYWVHPGTASANWSDVANWRTTSGGVTTHATPPTAADNVFFDGNSFAAAGRTVVVDVAAVCANMIWTGATNAPTLAINNPLTIHGNLTFIAGMTVNGTGVVTFTGANPQTITMAGKVFGGNVLWTKDAGSTATLADAFGTNGAFILQQGGDLNSANQNINCQRFEMVNVGTANMGTSTIQITGASNTPPSLDLSGGGIINVATATWNFSNTTSGATTRIVLGDNARNNGNITVAGAAALKNVIMEGSENHQIVALNIGNNVNFSQSTAGFAYTYSSITVAASTVAGAGVNFESTTTVTGTTTVGNLNAVTFKGGNTNLTGAVSFGNGNTVSFQNTGTVTFGSTLVLTATAPTTPSSTLTFANTVSNVTHTGSASFGGDNGINVNYGNTGTVTFSGTTTINNATSPNFNTITFGNTVTNVLHNNNVTINNRGVLNYNNTGFVNVGTSPTSRNFAISGTGSSVTLGTSVTTFSVTGNTNLGIGNTVTLDNSGSVFLGDGAGDTFTSGNGTTFNVGIGGAGKNFTISGNATFGTASAVSINNSGNTSINGNLIYNGSGSNFQYGNGGTVSFGGTVTAAGITGTLSVQFTNGNNTTYNGAVTLTTATGAGNSITYLFAGGQTANINANFTITGACDNLITVGITGSGSATLNLTATPANRNWVRVNVSNIDASSVANNIRAYAYTDGGGNSGIDFRNNSTSANRTLYWVAGGPQAGTNTLWSNANNWSFEPNEFIPAVCIPTVADSVVFGHDDISFSATNATVDVDGDYAVAGMRWSATDVTPVNPILRSVGGATRTLTIAGAFDSYRAAGTITFQNQSPTQRLNFTFTGARRTPANGWNEIRSGGVNFPREVVFNGNANNTRWRLIDNFSARIDAGANPSNNGSVYLQRGVFDTQEHDLIIGRFNANQYVANFTSPRELIISGASHWTIQGRSGNVTVGSLPVAQPPAIDLGGNGFTFNSPHPASYWYFSGANNDSTAVTEGAWVIIRLGREANVPREVPNIGIGRRHNDIDISVDAQPTPFNFRELRLSNTPPPANRQIYIQTWNDNNTQLIFKGLVDFGNNTNVNPNNNAGTVVRGPHAAPNVTWSNISRFEKAVIIGNNSQIPFWGNFRFDGPVTVGELSRVWFSRNGGGELIAPAGNRYRFNDDVTLGKASIAYFYANVDWPVAGKTLSIGEDALAYVGDVPSTNTFPTEYGINNWQNIVLGNQGKLVLNNGEGIGTSVNNTIANLTFGEFSVVELNTEVNTTNASATPRTRITGTMSSSFTGVCSSWATLLSVVDGKQADLIVNSAQTVNSLVVKDVNVVENVPGIDLTVNAGADAGNNSGSSSLLFTGARTGRNFYWVGGTNKDKTTNPFRKAIDTNYDGTPDDNGDNVVWSNPVNWYSEDGSLPRRTTLTAAMITSHNQCVPTIIDNVYFLDDSFKGGNNTGNIFQRRRNVLVDIPQAQARNFEWYITTAAFTTSGNTGAGFNADCTACGGPVRFTNEQQPILPTTEIQIAGNLRWAAPGGTLSTGIGVTETVLRNDFIARFSFIGSGTPHSGPGTGPTTHTIESNGQRFAGEVMFDNRYSTWTPLDAMDLNSHQHASSYPVPPAMLPGGATAWSRASIIINQGALDMSVANPKRINLEGDWTISGLFDHAHFDASTSEVVFDGSGNGGANANNANIIMHENIRVPAPNQPVNSPADDPNRDYDPTRRRFYDLTVNKRQNDWDVRVLNSPVSVLRNIYVQQGRLWDNNEGGSVPMQIKGKLSGTGTFRMDEGTLLNLGSNSNAGPTNRYGAPTYNWGTEFPAAVNGYPTTFPLGYTKADITLAPTSTVRYWQNGHQNVSIVPDYGNIEFVGHSAPTDFATNWGNLRKRHLIREDITGNVNYAAGNHAPGSASVPVFTPTNGGTLTVQGNWTQNGGIDFLDNGNQINLTGATPTLTVGAWAILTLGSGLDALSLDALNRTLPLVNHATTFPTGTPTLALDANSIVNYNAGTDQEVRGLNGAGNASYGHLMIANRDRSIAAPLPSLARKTLSAATTVRGQLRIYPNAHLIDNGNQITMTPGGRLHMYRVLPAVNNGTAAANINGLLDLYNLRTLPTTNGVATGSHHTMINSESRLTLGNATAATTFPTNVPQANLFLQNRTTIVYNAGVDQQIRQLATTDIATFADSVTLYANLVLINPTATLRTKTITGTTAAVVTSATNPAPSPASNNTVRGDLTIGANNTLADNGYQLRSHNDAALQQRFNMFVLKSSTDSYVPTFSNTGLPATFSMNNTVNVSAANGISRILMGTGTVSSEFPMNFRGTDDAEINFEVDATLPTPLYSQQVYNGGLTQNVAGLNQSINRIYGHLIFTNPLDAPVGPTPKVLQAATRVRGSIIINPNNNFLDNGQTITMTPSASSVVRLQMFSTNAAASTALDANGINPVSGADGGSYFTIGTAGTATTLPAGFPAYNNTHLNLQTGTTIVYASGVAQNIRPLHTGTATDNANYANLWLLDRATAATGSPIVKTVNTPGAGTWPTQVTVRGSLFIGQNNNLFDNGFQINGVSGQPFRMFLDRTVMATASGSPAIWQSITGGNNLYGGGTATPAVRNGASVLTLGNATIATEFPLNYADADIDLATYGMAAAQSTTVRYNAGVNQNIRGLFNATPTANNNYANVEIINSAAAGNSVKTLQGNTRIRGNLYIGGGVNANRNTTLVATASNQANTLAVGTNNINIQGHWVVFGSNTRATFDGVSTFSTANHTINNLFTSGTGTVTFEGNGRAQVVASGSIVTGTGSGFTETVSNRFYHVVIDKGTAGTVNGRTVYLREDPMLVQQTVTFTNGFFWSNADGTENGGTPNRQDDDNQLTFLNNPGVIQVLGPGTFAGAQGPHNNSYVVGAVRKIGTSATAASAVGGANTFDFPIGHTPFVTGLLPDSWLGRGYYYAPSGVLDLTANHDFVSRYYGTNANLAGATIPAGIRPQDLTNPGAGNHFPTNVKAASLRFINESEFWTIDYSSKVGPATPSGLPFRAKLSWDSNPNRTAVNTTFSAAPLKVAHWTNKGSGLMWYDESRSAALGTEVDGRGVQVSVSTTYNGPFNNADDAVSILPIELVSFSARAVEVEGDGGKVEVTWQTAWERDNDYFEVEKSRDGINFQSIARVEPKGNNGFSNSIQHYVHYDEQPWLGKNYYRLKQVDFDGTTTYSKIEVVIFERNALAPTAGNMEVYPNPFESNSQTLKVVLPQGGVGAGWLVVWDMAGREMYRERIEEGQTQLEITPNETQGKLAHGAYIIRAIGRDKAFTAKVVVE
jgi:hypothetical protein